MKVKNIMLCATALIPSLVWAKELPNIIYIVTDQQTASAMSCMGNDDLHTPNMDKLAQAGILFRNAYCSTPPEWACQSGYVYRLYFARSRTCPKRYADTGLIAYPDFGNIDAGCRL